MINKMGKVFEYTVPKDCTVKIEQSENSFVVLIESLKHIPKEGDFVRSTYKDGIGYFICGKYHDGAVYQQKETAMIDGKGDVFNRRNNHIAFPFNKACIFETITKEEFCKSINDLGYNYNFETNEIEPLKWRPKNGDEVYEVELNFGKFEVSEYTWNDYAWAEYKNVSKTVFQTETEAQQLCDKLNTVLNEK